MSHYGYVSEQLISGSLSPRNRGRHRRKGLREAQRHASGVVAGETGSYDVLREVPRNGARPGD